MRHALRRSALSFAALVAFADGASAQDGAAAATGASVSASASTSASAPAGISLRRAEALHPPPRGEAAKALPIILRAREVRARPDLDAEATGDVEFRRGPVVIHSDRLTYDQPADRARATGNVVVSRDGNVFSGPELELEIERFRGFFTTPTYRFAKTGAGGKATLIEFIDDQRANASDATYSSCTPEDGDAEPVWILKAESLRIDTETNQGIARNAVLRFYGVPILASPVLSFPLSEERKSGLLPPSFGLDSRSGFQAAIPYYWNIAPNRDATLTASHSVRRGVGIAGEFRYLEPTYAGEAEARWLPHDDAAGRSRYEYRLNHEGTLPLGVFTSLRLLRASDDDYWKDFPNELKSTTPRLLASDFQLARAFGDWSTYARVQRWQLLQTTDPTTRILPAPYERLPQVGARYSAPWNGFLIGLETEYNRFANPDDTYGIQRTTGSRFHALGGIARPFYTPGWTFTPKVAFNAAAYSLEDKPVDTRRTDSRIVPTLSVDSAWTLERDASFFGKAVRQTLEPRLFYVNTPYRRQDDLPNFDAYPKDFNYDSIFTENAFSGVDRVSDAHQITAGVTTRVLDPDTGAEALRLGLAQRYRFRTQRITPDGDTQTRRFSDILAVGSTSIVPGWTFDVQGQYNPDNSRIERSLLGFRYSPGPFRTVNVNYRLARGLSEQLELGWQWPIFGSPPAAAGADSAGTGPRTAAAGGGSCKGTLYGVGRINYSTRDRRLTDGIGGFEYDAGCWIGRLLVERISTGRSEATTRLLLQLELVGLSRIGSNPLRVLKDNIPGYQLLRDERATATPFTPYD